MYHLDWSPWENVDDELLMKVYQKAKGMEEKHLIKIVLAETRRRRLIWNSEDEEVT
ncbi:hypothetical protein [Ammoniphilus resinae]|uniref:Uncharacterized protein n=1 Tax=Ammoniphilus resinae TaxID=861532 RepID=A0ABS4GNQ4_9BACL|nr:hypothetical protein [Ammoniphilus resinae]MBP1931904.1 hypothetical protein [Ammoniphilus resinae]